MPWSNQSGGGGGGGWKGGGGGPWGQGPSGPNNQPDLEEILKRGKDQFKQVLPSSGLPGPLLLLIGIVAAAFIAYYGFFFRVNQDEQGVVLRFGKYHRIVEPGLHFRLPYPIEEVRLPPTARQNIIEVGFRSGVSQRGFGTGGVIDRPEESLMLTGDENIVDIDFVVQWKIRDAREFLFNIQNPEVTVKEVAESAMREIVGLSNIQLILTEQRQKTAIDVQKLMQKVLDSYGAGIQINQVQIVNANPPQQVIEAFRDVQAAKTDQQRLQNEAETYRNKVVPEAKGEAERILQAAEGYRQAAIAEAQGQTARFLKVYEEYKKAPDVTRQRLFLETMERVLGSTDKIIVDNKGGQGVVPFLPLNELNRRPATPPARGAQ